MPDAGDITCLLRLADDGHADAANELFVLVEKELRQIARARKRAAVPGIDAQTTVLIDEAFLRLVGKGGTAWEPGDRQKFYAFASTKIHDLLIDLAREQQAQKRGGDLQRVELTGAEDERSGEPRHLDLLLDLHSALERLAVFAPDDAILFRIRFFLECTFEQTAEILGLSKTEVQRRFQVTRLWLQRELKEYDLDS